MWRTLFVAFAGVFYNGLDAVQSLCSVYDPFKVQPDNNKFVIGGAFPLHDVDCKNVLPDTVQEIVAIQWALTHWNQNPVNNHAKLGLFAGDTCSRSQQAMSQSLRFLDTVGYHEPQECRTNNSGTKLLGLVAPKDYTSSTSLGKMLTSSELPVAAYSSKAATALIEMGMQNIIATTPTVEVYVEVLVRLMSLLYSNLVTVVQDGFNKELVERVTKQLNEADIFVAEVVDVDHPRLAHVLRNTDSNIILSLLSTKEFIRVLSHPSVYKMDKLWISLPTDGRALYDDQRSNLLNPEAQIQVITLQPQLMELPDFREYFLRVLRNNYQRFQLFTSFVQQVYNCSDTNCDVDKQHMQQQYRPSMSIEAAIRMTYAFAAVGHKIASDSESEDTCIHPTPECTALIIRELLALDYEFGTGDPPEFAGERLSFYRGYGNVLLASGMTVKVVEFFNSDGELTVHQMMTYTTGHQPTIISSAVRAKNQHKRSVCSPYRSFCGQCQNAQWVNEEQYFLSIPRHYPMYLVGLFDFHSGPSCQSTATTDISLPMAFIHTVSTIKQRFADMLLLKNFDFGVLFVDSCSSAKRAIEAVVMTETQCFSFSQADRNITIVPGSALGYVSALHGNSQEALKGYFSSGDSAAALLTIALDSISRHEYSAVPTARNQVLALLKFLSRMRWQFVTVALSEADAESLMAFRHFERLALERGICLAEVLNIRGVCADNLPISTTTNVTIVFATAREASAYLSLTLRSPLKVVHVMMGDAHDWYLHDTENRKHFQGIVSIQPKDVLHEDFREWARTTTPLTLPESWFWSYMENRWQCALTQKSKLTYGKMCTGDEQVDLNNLGRMTKAGYLSRGVERFLLIVDSVYKKLCPTQAGLCSDFYEDGRRMIMRQIEKTSVEDDIDIYEFLRVGNDQYTYRTIGNWSMNGGLHLHVLYHSFFNGPVESTCKPPMCKCFIDGDFFQQPLNSFLLKAEDVDTDRSTGSYVKKQPAFETEKVAYRSVFEHLSLGKWRQDPYNFLLLASITILAFTAIAVLVLVLVKMYLRVVKGNQSLGISLLIGIIILFVTAYFFIFDATDLVCRLRLAMHGFGYSLCFGVMIAKATQLRNAETLGFGSSVHISFWNYWLLLFFIIGVQIALNTRWMTEPFMSTIAVSDSRTEMVCTMGREEFVLANIYVVILLFLTLFINSINRNIKRNYKETKWLFVSSILCTLTWLSWVPAYIAVPNEFKEKVIVLELIFCASILLGLLFGPKIYILLSYEPVLVEYKENQMNKEVALFEKDDLPSVRAVSPASSSGSSTQSTTAAHSSRGASGSPNYEEQFPIFHTVMKKKSKVRRSQSQHELSEQGYTRPEVAIVHAVSRPASLGLKKAEVRQ